MPSNIILKRLHNCDTVVKGQEMGQLVTICADKLIDVKFTDITDSIITTKKDTVQNNKHKEV
jgi:hypothetical protein